MKEITQSEMFKTLEPERINAIKQAIPLQHAFAMVKLQMKDDDGYRYAKVVIISSSSRHSVPTEYENIEEWAPVEWCWIHPARLTNIAAFDRLKAWLKINPRPSPLIHKSIIKHSNDFYRFVIGSINL